LGRRTGPIAERAGLLRGWWFVRWFGALELGAELFDLGHQGFVFGADGVVGLAHRQAGRTRELALAHVRIALQQAEHF